MFSKLVLISVLSYWTSSALNALNIPRIHSNQEILSNMNRAAVEILSLCFADFKEIVVHGDSDNSTIKSLKDIEWFHVIVLNNSSVTDHNTRQLRGMHLFAVMPSSFLQLHYMLRTFMRSPRWDINAPLFILDQSNPGCEKGWTMLQMAWQVELVNTYFLCISSYGTAVIFSYNPYTNLAPQPWKKILSPIGRPDGWTLFVCTRPVERNMCEGLKFDRFQYSNDSSGVRLSVDCRLFAFAVFLSIVSNIGYLLLLRLFGIVPSW